MSQLFYKVGGQFFQWLLGCDGIVTVTLLAFAMWCGHYAIRGARSRPGEVLVLGPLCLASFVGAAIFCGSVWKFLALAVAAILTYSATVRASNARRFGR